MPTSEESVPLAERFATLRELLSTSTDFLVPWNYFHDEMAARSDFMALGKYQENAIINLALKGVMKKFGLLSRPKAMLTYHIEEHAFWHGIRHFSSKTGIFFFDDTLGQGIFGLMKDLSRGPIDLFRFTTVAVEKGAAFPMPPVRRGPPQ